jgi:hypothetical protein
MGELRAFAQEWNDKKQALTWRLRKSLRTALIDYSKSNDKAKSVITLEKNRRLLD